MEQPKRFLIIVMLIGMWVASPLFPQENNKRRFTGSNPDSINQTDLHRTLLARIYAEKYSFEKKPHAVITTLNNEVYEGKMLYTTDTSIVVCEINSSEPPEKTLQNSISIDILRIEYIILTKKKTTSPCAGMFFGSILGGTAGSVIGRVAADEEGFSELINGIEGMVIGAVIGAVAGNLLARSTGFTKQYQIDCSQTEFLLHLPELKNYTLLSFHP